LSITVFNTLSFKNDFLLESHGKQLHSCFSTCPIYWYK